jgi:hypothetical protein
MTGDTELYRINKSTLNFNFKKKSEIFFIL